MDNQQITLCCDRKCSHPLKVIRNQIDALEHSNHKSIKLSELREELQRSSHPIGQLLEQ